VKKLSPAEKSHQCSFFFSFNKKEKYNLCSFFPSPVSFPHQLCFSSFRRLLKLFALPCLQLENLTKHWEKKHHLIRNIYQMGLIPNPKRSTKSHNAVNLNVALIFSVLCSTPWLDADTMARCLQHPKGHRSGRGTATGTAPLDLGCCSCCTTRRPEGRRRSRCWGVITTALGQGQGTNRLYQPWCNRAREASPGWLQGGLAMEMMHPVGRGWVQETLPEARSCLSEPSCRRLPRSITPLPTNEKQLCLSTLGLKNQ